MRRRLGRPEISRRPTATQRPSGRRRCLGRAGVGDGGLRHGAAWSGWHLQRHRDLALERDRRRLGRAGARAGERTGTEPAPEAVAAPVETTEPVVADTAVASAEDSGRRTTMPTRWSWKSGSIPSIRTPMAMVSLTVTRSHLLHRPLVLGHRWRWYLRRRRTLRPPDRSARLGHGRRRCRGWRDSRRLTRGSAIRAAPEGSLIGRPPRRI